MHDLLEGVCQYDLGNILHHFILEKSYFTLSDFNTAIRGFGYIRNDKQSMPADLTIHHLKNKRYMMSAAEMLSLTRNLPMIIGHLVPQDSEHMELIVFMHKIIWCVTEKYSQVDTYELLDTLIAEYLTCLQELFPDCFKPKHHFLIHYGRVMELLGPIWHISSMNFERKHRSGKITAHSSLSRRDIFYSILTFKVRLGNGNEYVAKRWC